ncbi:SPOR domain-containing protein [Phaeovulum sp. W22_SRMD_FR3]|uniref:SPOR domain-containing protein n=1 Tax=Phaeovulum sp. W22_SRMD_FR3 TaxID=3240274 RepID=UPI003F9E0E59
MARRVLQPKVVGIAGLMVIGMTLAGCDSAPGFLGGKGGSGASDTAPRSASSTRLVERDVEAPEIFSVDDQGLWDGRPSLGGVWVAHPTVKDPERVIIRNTANGKFVIGALFRRELDNPGPKFQVSSDAAAALGMLAGQPAKLSVVALTREEAAGAEAVEAPDAASDVVAAPGGALASESIEARPIDQITSAAAGAIAQAETKPAAQPAAAAPKAAASPAASPAPAKPASTPAASGKMLIQIGIFSTEANAKRAASQMSAAGVTATVKTESSQGKTFWRVVAGPAADVTAREAMLTKIKGLGYSDAYAVTR